MSKFKKSNKVNKIETESEYFTSSESEEEDIEPRKIILEKQKMKGKKEKEVKEKKPFVMTDARKQAFEKAKATRDENIKINKEIKEKEKEELVLLKQMAKNTKLKKLSKLKKVIEQHVTSEDEEEEEIIYKKKKPSKKKKVVYISDSDEEYEKPDKKNVIIINNGKTEDIKAKPRIIPRPPFSYFL